LIVSVSLLVVSCSSAATFTAADLPPTVRVSDEGDWISLLPSDSTVSLKPLGLMFYPGGLVKPEAYELALAPIAAAGHPVVIVKMPFDLAFFDAEKGYKVKQALPSVSRWVIGGHSLGGLASAIAVGKHPTSFAGVVFWGAYTTKDYSLAALSLPVLSISASNDGLSTPEKMAVGVPFLPANTKNVVIKGGIHAQFGTYGPQKGDGTATISREEQQAQTAAATLEFLAQF
jgi:dienelactone hydrolase